MKRIAEEDIELRILLLKTLQHHPAKDLAAVLLDKVNSIPDGSSLSSILEDNVPLFVRHYGLETTSDLLKLLFPHSETAFLKLLQFSDLSSSFSAFKSTILKIFAELEISAPEAGLAYLETDGIDEVQTSDAFGRMKPAHQLMAIHIFNLKHRACIISKKSWTRAAAILKRNDLLQFLTAYTLSYVNLDKSISTITGTQTLSWESTDEREHAMHLLAFKYRGVYLDDDACKKLECVLSPSELGVFRSKENSCVESNRSQELDDRIERMLGEGSFRNLRWYHRFDCEPVDAFSRS